MGDAIAPGLALPALEGREVERLHRLVDKAALVLGVEHLADDALGRLDRQVRDLAADLADRADGLGVDLLARVLEPPLALGLGLLLRAVDLRIGDLARLREDVGRLRACLREDRPVLLEQLARLASRALSASSTAWRIRSRRSSIVFWIGPNAYFRSTKNAIAKQISVQIMRPGTTSIRPLPPSSVPSAVSASRFSIGSMA